MVDMIIVGAGFAGAVVANRAAEAGKKVLVLEKRDHIGGNAYDYTKDNILIHQYGPHIFHTKDQEVMDYLSKFGEWEDYQHKVLGHISGKLVPIPFNFSSIEECFSFDTAKRLKRILAEEYGKGNKVPIMELRKSKYPDIKMLAEFIFENVFKYYTMKQWGLTAEEIDPEVTARVPVRVSYKDTYFDDPYICMPKDGYTAIFKKLLDHPNIELILKADAKKVLSLKDGKIYLAGKEYTGKVVYTGALDELFDYSLGELPYRSLYFETKEMNGTFQKVATENYPGKDSHFPYTRITEYKHFYPREEKEPKTFIHIEYPLAYDRHAEKGNIPYYPIFTSDNEKMYMKYRELASKYPNLILLGRLAEYKYYNMDAIVKKALELEIN